MQRTRLRRSREATGALAGRKHRAPCATDAACAILTKGNFLLFPFLLCEGRLSSVRMRREDRDGKRRQAEQRPMGPQEGSPVTYDLSPRRRPARAWDEPGGRRSRPPGHRDSGTLTTRCLAFPGLAVPAVVASLQAPVFHHGGHGGRCRLGGPPRLSAPADDFGRARGVRGSRLSAQFAALRPISGRQPVLLGCTCEPCVCAQQLPCASNNPCH